VKVFRISLASLAVCAVCAVPAHAKTGNGLYEPFPSPQAGSAAQTFIEGLGGGAGAIGLSVDELRRGVVFGRGPAPGPGAPSARGGLAGSRFAPSFGWALGLALIALALGTARRTAVRRA
jgi:hypothetical protein